MERIKTYLQLTWAGNLARLAKRKACCEQRIRWTPHTVQRVRESTNNKCFYCRTELDKQNTLHERSYTRMHIDHYWPWSKGGSNVFQNLVPSCARCNLAKSNMRALVFTRRHPYTQPFCRHLLEQKYCLNQPGRGQKYCLRHRFPAYVCNGGGD